MNDVALIDGRPNFQVNSLATFRCARRRPFQFYHLTDFKRSCSTARLGILSRSRVASQRTHHFRGQNCAVGRFQMSWCTGAEISNHQLTFTTMTDQQIAALPLIVTVKQKFGVLNQNPTIIWSYNRNVGTRVAF